MTTNKKAKKPIPKFSSELEEQEYWPEADSTDHINWSKASKGLFPNLKPTLKTVSIRMPEFMILELKMLAHKRDVPYQALAKMFLAERLQRISRIKS